MPKPSLRRQRRRVTLWACALVAGLVALILAGGAANEYLMPGRLASQHANLKDCQSCHADVRPEKLGWLHGLAGSAGPKDNAGLCIACHDAGPQPFAPHTTPVDDLKQMTQASVEKSQDGEGHVNDWITRVKFALPNATMSGQPQRIFCATCHQEHQGSLSDLTAVSNDRCQTCHVSKFGSFEESHPAFTNYPFDQRTGIIFDHKSHFEKHFSDTAATTGGQAKVPAMCETCHTPASNGRFMTVRSFDGMCSSCHGSDVLGQTIVSGPKGVNFLSIPGLDVETLTEKGIDIGVWPVDSEAEITPFMRSLLLLVLQGRDIVGEVAGLDLLDLRDASDTDLEKVKTLAWAVKQLFLNMEIGGLPAAMTGETPDTTSMADHQQMALMTGVMSHDVIRAGNRQWLPDLRDDIARHDAGQPTASFDNAVQQQETLSSAGTDTVTPAETGSSETLSLGDDILSGDDQIGNELILEGDLEVGEDTIPGLEEAAGSEADNLLLAPAGASDQALDESGLGGDGVLSADDPDEALSEDGILAGRDQTDEDILAGGMSGDGDGLLAQGGLGKEVAEETDPASDKSEADPFDPEVWAEFGGWYRQDFTIRYRPTGHKDPFLKTWLDYSSRAATDEERALLSPVFETLSDPGAAGRCMKCHSVDTSGEARNVRWKPFDPADTKTRFTRFSHEPHISAVGAAGCKTCHALVSGADAYLQSYKQGNPAVHAPNFSPLEKSTCAGCHTEQAAGEECTLCHQYHTGGFSLPLIQTRLPGQ